MNLADIETFLTVVNTKSVTQTAKMLFLTQPTVTHRLNSLEAELGFPLMIRKKGCKQVELTERGLDFIPVAERWVSLWKETQNLSGAEDRVPLSIGCTDSMNVVLLAPLYEGFLKAKPQVNLTVHTHQSRELYGLLANHDIDLAFVYHNLPYKNIRSDKIFEERLYLAQTDEPAVSKPVVRMNELDTSKEIFMSWDDNYQIWRGICAGGVYRPRVSVDTVAMLDRLWSQPDHWVIAPESVIAELSRRRRLYVSEIESAPPNRSVYKIKRQVPKLASHRVVALFESAVEEYLEDLKFPIKIGEVFGGRD